MVQQDLPDGVTDLLAFMAPIEQAKGILMGRRKVGPRDAGRMLTTIAAQTHRPVHEVAVRIIAGEVRQRLAAD